jgi:Mlc titration factor MtfA (ptsG expression regulator)
MTIQFLISLIFGSIFVVAIIFKVIEPAYLLLFEKPLYIHWYPFPKKITDNHKLILKNNFGFYTKLSVKRKKYFEHRVKEFMSNYEFIGKDITVTDEIQLLIAGTYVMLTFGMRDYLSPLFAKIIIYPTHYYSTLNQTYHKGEFNPRMKAVVFSWEDFLLGHSATNDNINLGLHEFSHILHFTCLKTNTPSAILFYDEFNQVVKYYNDEKLNQELLNKGYFRAYAYENQFEFLSVILEHFFETPHVFKLTHPELFAHVFAMINFKEEYINEKE